MPEINPALPRTTLTTTTSPQQRQQEIDLLIQDAVHLLTGRQGPLPSGQNRNIGQIQASLQQLQGSISPQQRQQITTQLAQGSRDYFEAIQTLVAPQPGPNATPQERTAYETRMTQARQAMTQAQEQNTFLNGVLPQNQRVPLLSPQQRQQITQQATAASQSYFNALQDIAMLTGNPPGPGASTQERTAHQAALAQARQGLATTQALHGTLNEALPQNQRVPLLSPQQRQQITQQATAASQSYFNALQDIAMLTGNPPGPGASTQERTAHQAALAQARQGLATTQALHGTLNEALPQNQRVPLLSPQQRQQITQQATAASQSYFNALQDIAMLTGNPPGPGASVQERTAHQAALAQAIQGLETIQALHGTLNEALPQNQRVPLLSPQQRQQITQQVT